MKSNIIELHPDALVSDERAVAQKLLAGRDYTTLRPHEILSALAAAKIMGASYLALVCPEHTIESVMLISTRCSTPGAAFTAAADGFVLSVDLTTADIAKYMAPHLASRKRICAADLYGRETVSISEDEIASAMTTAREAGASTILLELTREGLGAKVSGAQYGYSEHEKTVATTPRDAFYFGVEVPPATVHGYLAYVGSRACEDGVPFHLFFDARRRIHALGRPDIDVGTYVASWAQLAQRSLDGRNAASALFFTQSGIRRASELLAQEILADFGGRHVRN